MRSLCCKGINRKADLRALLANRVKQSITVISCESDWKQCVIEHIQAEVKYLFRAVSAINTFGTAVCGILVISAHRRRARWSGRADF